MTLKVLPSFQLKSFHLGNYFSYFSSFAISAFHVSMVMCASGPASHRTQEPGSIKAASLLTQATSQEGYSEAALEVWAESLKLNERASNFFEGSSAHRSAMERDTPPPQTRVWPSIADKQYGNIHFCRCYDRNMSINGHVEIHSTMRMES